MLAGPQTVALRRQLEALPDGGVFTISIPKAPYRCPPGPYERASVVAQCFKQHRLRSKIVILDANPDIVSKKGLFLKAWTELYPGIIEYRPNAEVEPFDPCARPTRLLAEVFKADLFNSILPQQAGRVAQSLINVNKRWLGGFPDLRVTARTGRARDRRRHIVGAAHAGYGCTVRTTAEVLLALLPRHHFTREPVAATGWAELVIGPVDSVR